VIATVIAAIPPVITAPVIVAFIDRLIANRWRACDDHAGWADGWRDIINWRRANDRRLPDDHCGPG